ncbi:unnamed protein product [Soboliphyme baturini]|uniref:Secreted protein n=1 Tax=Soboliphyme baturini TaxID=241478 RepID=A0A183IDI0_9BILA|nr:unnamed protein product [Soboliphyme baturini]
MDVRLQFESIWVVAIGGNGGRAMVRTAATVPAPGRTADDVHDDRIVTAKQEFDYEMFTRTRTRRRRRRWWWWRDRSVRCTGLSDRQTDGLTDGQMDRRTDGRMLKETIRQSVTMCDTVVCVLFTRDGGGGRHPPIRTGLKN